MIDGNEQEQVNLSTDEVLMDCAGEMGFVETAQMRQLRGELPGIETLDAFTSKVADYQRLGEQQVDKCDDIVRPKAQIGLIIVTAAIYYKQGLFSDSTDVLKDAIKYAHNMRYEEIVNELIGLLLLP